MTGRYVVFSHGLESGPWGTKISALADVARAEGFEVESVDYRGVRDPEARVTRLLAYCRACQGRLILVGSSLGGLVATASARLLRAEGLFLLAPAFYMEGHDRLRPAPPNCPVEIVHGWRDDVVPIENSVRFAREYGATLHAYDTDHRMHDRIRELTYLFEFFLARLDPLVSTLEVQEEGS
ncbi:MAG: alpha/beta hydrolase [Steroidobacteraceae bacterium]|jgi:pimeloyl-ACP methyl ester carboxylesterase|nr:alpha/beta hydrolase [Steroidobacteraceae bacterium]